MRKEFLIPDLKPSMARAPRKPPHVDPLKKPDAKYEVYQPSIHNKNFGFQPRSNNL